MRISDWSSDVCSSDLYADLPGLRHVIVTRAAAPLERATALEDVIGTPCDYAMLPDRPLPAAEIAPDDAAGIFYTSGTRSEEHTSELQSLMRISYAVFCLKKKKKTLHDNAKT